MPFYELSMKLWEGLEQDLNYNAMVSQRGVLNLYHSDAQRDAYRAPRQRDAAARRRCRAARPRRRCARMVPFLDFDNARFPIQGGLLQRRGGTARHDAVAWGYARGADMRGVDIIAELRGHRHRHRGRPRHRRRDDARHRSARKKVGLAVAGNTSRVAAMAGLRLPIESHVLQAFVSEGIKPADRSRRHLRRRAFLHQPVRQGRARVRRRHRRLQLLRAARQPADRRGRDGRAAWRSGPALGRMRMLRQWGGIMDMSMDGSPIIDRTPVDGLYLNCGWCYGGFKATPASGWCFAHLIARDEPHPVAAAYRLDRFATGALIDETRRRRAAEPALRRAMRIPCPYLRPRGNERVHLSRRCERARVPIRRAPDAPTRVHDYVYLRDNRPACTASSGITAAAAARGWWSRATRARTTINDVDVRATAGAATRP